MNVGVFWDGPTTERLKDLWGQGLSGGAIARALGGGITRNAVIGKAHRLGLQGRPERSSDGERQPSQPLSRDRVVKMKPAARKLEISKAPHPEPARSDNGELIGTADLKDCHCRWPHGDVGAADFHYCGHPKTKGSSWCEFHQVRASEGSQPPSPETGSLGRQAHAAKVDATFLRMFG